MITDKLADTHWYKDTTAKIIKSKNNIAKKNKPKSIFNTTAQ